MSWPQYTMAAVLALAAIASVVHNLHGPFARPPGNPHYCKECGERHPSGGRIWGAVAGVGCWVWILYQGGFWEGGSKLGG